MILEYETVEIKTVKSKKLGLNMKLTQDQKRELNYLILRLTKANRYLNSFHLGDKGRYCYYQVNGIFYLCVIYRDELQHLGSSDNYQSFTDHLSDKLAERKTFLTDLISNI